MTFMDQFVINEKMVNATPETERSMKRDYKCCCDMIYITEATVVMGAMDLLVGLYGGLDLLGIRLSNTGTTWFTTLHSVKNLAYLPLSLLLFVGVSRRKISLLKTAQYYLLCLLILSTLLELSFTVWLAIDNVSATDAMFPETEPDRFVHSSGRLLITAAWLVFGMWLLWFPVQIWQLRIVHKTIQFLTIVPQTDKWLHVPSARQGLVEHGIGQQTGKIIHEQDGELLTQPMVNGNTDNGKTEIIIHTV